MVFEVRFLMGQRSLIVFAFFAVVSASCAAWQDNFDSYSVDTLGSPWQNVTSMIVSNNIGYGGTTGAKGPNDGWSWGHAWRPISNDCNVAYARIYGSTYPYSTVKISISGTKSVTVDNIAILLESSSTSSGEDTIHGKILTLIAEDYNDAGGYLMDNRVEIMNLSTNQWYDVRIILDDSHTKATGQYRISGSLYWITVGSVKLYAGFSPVYVGIHAERQAYIDDVACQIRDDNEPYLKFDVVRDGYINNFDLSDFSDRWLDSGTSIASDFDSSGTVEFKDFARFAEYWLGCTDRNAGCWSGLIHCSDIGGRMETSGCSSGQWCGKFSVSVQDRNATPVAGATITMSFSGSHTGTASGIADSNGQAVIATDCTGAGLVTTATVTKVSAPGKFYEASMNQKNSCYAFREDANQPALIQFGQTTPDANLLRTYAAYFENYLPFDGVAINVHKNLYMGRFGDICFGDNQGWDLGHEVFSGATITPDYSSYNQTAADMSAAAFNKFKHNFVTMDTYCKDWFAMNWFDETHWTNVLNNAKLLARIAKESGCEGILFDTEQYGANTFWNYTYLKLQYPSQPQAWSDWRSKAYSRGRSFITAIQSEFPNVKILITFGMESVHSHLAGSGNPADMNNYIPPAGVDYSAAPYALLCPFIEGMLKQRSGNTQIIDGYEPSYYYKHEWEFEAAKNVVKNRCKVYCYDPTLYTNNIKLGFGLYHFSLRQDGLFSANEARESLKLAMKHTDKYVWIWNENRSYWIKCGPSGKRVVPPYAQVCNTNPAAFTMPGTEENAMSVRYYGMPQNYIDAYFEGKSQFLE